MGRRWFCQGLAQGLRWGTQQIHSTQKSHTDLQEGPERGEDNSCECSLFTQERYLIEPSCPGKCPPSGGAVGLGREGEAWGLVKERAVRACDVAFSDICQVRAALLFLQCLHPSVAPPVCDPGRAPFLRVWDWDSEELNGGGFRPAAFLRALLGGIRARLGAVPSTAESKLCDWWLALSAEPFSLDRGRVLWETGVELSCCRLLPCRGVGSQEGQGRICSANPLVVSSVALCFGYELEEFWLNNRHNFKLFYLLECKSTFDMLENILARHQQQINCGCQFKVCLC